MPNILRLKDVKKYWREQHKDLLALLSKLNTCDDSKRKGKYYSSNIWKLVRHRYYVDNPLCELCKVEDNIVEGDDIHHCVKYFNQSTEELKTLLLTDMDNLICVCRECHNNIHHHNDLLTTKLIEFIRHKELFVIEKYAELNIYIINN